MGIFDVARKHSENKPSLTKCAIVQCRQNFDCLGIQKAIRFQTQYCTGLYCYCTVVQYCTVQEIL